MIQRVVKVSEITMFYKNNEKKVKKFKFEDICWPLKLCLRDFAEQSLHCSIISRGKEQSLRNFAGQRKKALWFRGAKSALLHNFAGQSLHCSISLRGKDMDFRPKIQQLMRFSYFLKKYFNMWQLFQRSIAPWWPLFRKKIPHTGDTNSLDRCG